MISKLSILVSLVWVVFFTNIALACQDGLQCEIYPKCIQTDVNKPSFLKSLIEDLTASIFSFCGTREDFSTIQQTCHKFNNILASTTVVDGAAIKVIPGFLKAISALKEIDTTITSLNCGNIPKLLARFEEEFDRATRTLKRHHTMLMFNRLRTVAQPVFTKILNTCNSSDNHSHLEALEALISYQAISQMMAPAHISLLLETLRPRIDEDRLATESVDDLAAKNESRKIRLHLLKDLSETSLMTEKDQKSNYQTLLQIATQLEHSHLTATVYANYVLWRHPDEAELEDIFKFANSDSLRGESLNSFNDTDVKDWDFLIFLALANHPLTTSPVWDDRFSQILPRITNVRTRAMLRLALLEKHQTDAKWVADFVTCFKTRSEEEQSYLLQHILFPDCRRKGYADISWLLGTTSYEPYSINLPTELKSELWKEINSFQNHESKSRVLGQFGYRRALSNDLLSDPLQVAALDLLLEWPIEQTNYRLKRLMNHSKNDVRLQNKLLSITDSLQWINEPAASGHLIFEYSNNNQLTREQFTKYLWRARHWRSRGMISLDIYKALIQSPHITSSIFQEIYNDVINQPHEQHVQSPKPDFIAFFLNKMPVSLRLSWCRQILKELDRINLGQSHSSSASNATSILVSVANNPDLTPVDLRAVFQLVVSYWPEGATFEAQKTGLEQLANSAKIFTLILKHKNVDPEIRSSIASQINRVDFSGEPIPFFKDVFPKVKKDFELIKKRAAD